MIKISNIKKKNLPVISMSKLEPLQVAIVVDDNGSGSYNHVVMRTASEDEFEVMDLTVPGIDRCWTTPNNVAVSLLEPGEVVTLEISN